MLVLYRKSFHQKKKLVKMKTQGFILWNIKYDDQNDRKLTELLKICFCLITTTNWKWKRNERILAKNPRTAPQEKSRISVRRLKRILLFAIPPHIWRLGNMHNTFSLLKYQHAHTLYLRLNQGENDTFWNHFLKLLFLITLRLVQSN